MSAHPDVSWVDGVDAEVRAAAKAAWAGVAGVSPPGTSKHEINLAVLRLVYYPERAWPGDGWLDEVIEPEQG